MLELNYIRTKAFKLLIWLAHRVGYKSKLHLAKCPLCTAQSFMIDSYLYFYLDNFPKSPPVALRLDLEISDAVIICRHCGEEIKVKDAAVELIKLIISELIKLIISSRAY
jgi:Zn finger protein HypA/HybF involved in hydrogenase expression